MRCVAIRAVSSGNNGVSDPLASLPGTAIAVTQASSKAAQSDGKRPKMNLIASSALSHPPPPPPPPPAARRAKI